MRLSVLLAILPAVLAAPATRSVPAPLVRLNQRADVVANKYIVKFKDNSALASLDSALSTISVAPEYTFEHVFKGFSGELSQEALEALRNHPDVDFIEEDAYVYLDGFLEQSNAAWGLGRISHRERGSTTYVYDETAGEGTCAYIIDTGIDVTHTDFEGRATFAVNYGDSNNIDGHGHGTHVAGTIGSKTYGIAKKTSLFAVKVLDNNGSGTVANMIRGLEFVVSDVPTRGCPNGAVANMSLRSSVSAALNAAAAALPNNDIFLAVSAGNSNIDSSNQSPAAEPTVCTIGSTDSADAKSSFSNYGPGVDVFAPGSSVLSLAPGNLTATMSGTSMASPHAAGLAAYLGGLEGLKGDALCERIKELASVDLLTGLPSGTSNRLAFNGNPGV
ncbi:unnamed protein product [Clonostachys rosea]|uniref:Peptidase S8/S53 domain-containing protein n=1 Tax=Bionectria ochroleuca TaxID=29856 RepID=A0ABY6TQI4_BIOOC|nr:unnamed protein product [Clonostachys rosea]